MERRRIAGLVGFRDPKAHLCLQREGVCHFRIKAEHRIVLPIALRCRPEQGDEFFIMVVQRQTLDVVIEHTGHQILPHQILRSVDLFQVVLLAAGDFVQQPQRIEVVVLRPAAEFEAPFELFLIELIDVAVLRKEGKPQHICVHIGLGSVVAPDGGEDLPDAQLFAGGHGRMGGAVGDAPVGSVSYPRPDAAGKDRLPEDPVHLDEPFVEFLIKVIVVPIDRLHVVGDQLRCIRREPAQVCAVIITAAEGTEEHIAPHHGLQPQLPDDLHHPCQMFLHDLLTWDQPVLRQIPPSSQVPRLVHADVDALGPEGLRRRLDQVLHEFVGLVPAHKEGLVILLDVVEDRPFQHVDEVRQGLDAGNHLNAQLIGVVVALPKLLLGVAGTHIAEIRLLGDVVAVLAVHHEDIQPHHGHPPEDALYRFHP